jgi:hypothetical protein
MIRISISNNPNKISIIVDYVLKYYSRWLKELCKRYDFKASLNLFLSPDKSLIAVGRGL